MLIMYVSVSPCIQSAITPAADRDDQLCHCIVSWRSLCFIITAGAVATRCINDKPCQWQKANFDPQHITAPKFIDRSC